MKRLLLLVILLASFLRLWRLDQVPVSLFGDELDVGYHAYSILKTGRDYSGNFMPLHFQSLAEWRTPLYLYSAVATVALFGISPLGVRLPAAIFGILGVLVLYLLINKLTNHKSLAVIAAAVMAFSPWHIQYSRAGFEVTLLIFLLLFGLYFFFKALKDGKWLWISMVCLAFTAWAYSTAKLFSPLLLVCLFLMWRKEILRLTKSDLVRAAIAGLIVGLPIVYSTLFGTGTERFRNINVFTLSAIESEIGPARLRDQEMRGETGERLAPKFFDRAFHNRFTFWGENILKNYFEAFSFEFLFNKGDLNLRHSIGMGQLYKVEIIPLLVGLVFFFRNRAERRLKILVLFWLTMGTLPAAITRDGGRHATRLILVLPALVFLIAFGLSKGLEESKGVYRKFFVGIYLLLFTTNFVFYQHEYWIHYPWNSERWWHAGFEDAIQSIKEVEKDYDKIIISMDKEPAWIFFAGWYEYPPDKWHQEFPIGNDVEVNGFGKISHTGKFYFGSPQGGLYDWGKIMDTNTVYVASEKEVKVNLIREPERTPGDLVLMKSIAYPSGEPAFYLFTKKGSQ